MTDPSFVHLHVHSEYSLLDGAARIEPPKSNPGAPTIFTEAERLGMPAVAVTDHGVDVRRAAVLRGRPGRRASSRSSGSRRTSRPGSRFDRNPGESEEKYYHLTLLAENETGYRNLLKLVTLRPPRGLLPPAAHGQAAHGRARRGRASASPGACPPRSASRCSRARTTGRGGSPASTATSSAPTTTSSSSRTTGSPSSTRSCGASSSWATSSGIPLVATNDLHYTLKEDAKPHDVLLCIQQQKLQTRPEAAQVRLRGVLPEERRGDAPALPRASRGLRPDAARSPSASSSTSSTATVRRPTSGTTCRGSRRPAGIDRDAYLRAAGRTGRGRALRRRSPTEVRDRIDHELGVITSMGFGGYFLIVWDLIRHAREQGIRVGPGRGSAAGLGRLLLPAHHRPRPAALRPAVRAVPEPRAHPDARHRHGLRRAPARRGDPLRHREVRRGPRRADHHVPDDQGEAGDPRRRARARLPAGGGRPALQDVPAGGDGPRLPDRGRAEALARARARPTRRSPRPRRSSRRPGRSRGCAARTRSTPPAS